MGMNHELEEQRPSLDINGTPIQNGDLVKISSRGILLMCFIADGSPDGIVPADEESKNLERWADSPDWDSVEFVRRPGPSEV